MKMIRYLFVIWMIVGLSGIESYAQSTVGSCPNYGSGIRYIDKNCGNFLPTPSELRLGGARMRLEVCTAKQIDFYIPQNRPTWAIAFAHVWQNMRNILHGDYMSINYIWGIGIRETNMVCDQSATWAPQYNLNPLANGCYSYDALTQRDGCFQIDQSSGWPIYTTSPGWYKWRFGASDHPTFASGANVETEAHLRLMYDLAFIRYNQYFNPTSILEQYYKTKTDPYGLERILAYSWNGGIYGATSLMTSANLATWAADNNICDKVPGTYSPNVAAYTAVLDGAASSPVCATGSTVYGTNHEWYDAMISWADVNSYIDKMLPLYREANGTTVKANVKAVFDAINGGNPVSFRYQFSPVVDELSANLPFYDPLDFMLNDINSTGGCKLSGVVPQVTITAGGPTSFCNGLDVTLTTQLGSGYTYQWTKDGVVIPSTNSNTYVATASGVYGVNITMANGTKAQSECPMKVTVTNCSSCTMTAATTSTNSSCTGKTDGSIAVTLTNPPAGSLIYKWTGPVNGTNTNTSNPYTISSLPDGLYNIEVTRASDPTCKALSKIVVNSTIKLYQTLSIDSLRTSCSKVNLTGKLTDNPPSQCQWTLKITNNSGGTLGDNLFIKLALDGSENLSLTKTDLPTGTITVTKPITVSNSSAISMYFQAFAQPCYYWGNADKYKIELIDAKGNTAFSFVPVANSGTYINANSTINITSSPITANCAQTAPTYTYTWTPNTGLSSTNTLATTATLPSTTTYTLTAVPGSNPSCQLTSTMTVPYNCTVTCTPPATTPTFVSTSVKVCSPATVGSVVATLPSGVYYQLFNSSNNAAIGTSAGPTATAGNVTFNNIAAGSYHIRIASSVANLTAATCYKASTTPVTVTVNPLPTVSVTPATPSVCVGTTVTLTGNPTGGTWTSATTTVATINGSGVASGVAAGTSVITYSYTDANSCTNAATQTLTVNAKPTVSITPATPKVCIGATVNLTGSPAGGTWTSGTTTVATINSTGVASGIAAGTSVITYSYTDANSCSNTSTQSLTVNAKPTVTVTPATPKVCEGSTVTLTGNPTGGTWTSGTTTVATINGAGVATGVAAGTSVITYSYTDANNCSNTATQTLTVNAKPVVSITPATPSVCEGVTVTLSGTPSGGTYLSGTTSVATINSSGVASGVLAGTSVITYSYTDANSCTNTSTQTLTVTSSPKLTITNPAPVCSPAVVNLTAAAVTAGSTGGGTLTYWTNSTATTALTTPGAEATSGTYYIKSTAGSCSDVKPVVVTINTTPPAPGVISPASYCQNVTASPLTAMGPGLKWYTVSAGGTALPSAPTPNTTTVGTTSYWVSSTSGTCEGPRAKIDVVVGNTLASPSVAPVNYCQGATSTALTAGGTNLLWYTSSSGGTGSSVAPVPTTSAVGATSYWVSQTSGSCESSRSQIDVTVIANPAAPGVSNPPAYCLGATAVPLTASGSNLLWYTQPSGGTVTSTPITPSTSASGTISFYVTQTVNSCESSRAKIDVTVNTVPSAPTTATNPISYCQNSTASPLTASGTSLNWYTVASGGTSSTTAPTPLTTTIGSPSESHWVSQVVGGCESARLKIDVNIVSSLSAPTVSNATYCQGATAAALTAGGINLLWYTGPSGGIGSSTAPTPSTTTVGTSSYYVSQTSGTCESPRAQIDITINSGPSAPGVTNPGPYCIGATAAPLTATGTNLLWYTGPSGGVGSTVIPTPSTSTAGTTSYYVSQTSGTCESPRVQIDVVVNATPAAPSASNPTPYCVGVTATPLSATGTGLLWYTVASGGTGNTVIPTPSTNTAGTTSYWVSQTIGSCESSRTKIDVVVNDIPTAPVTSNPAPYCQGDAASLLTATGNNLKWYSTATGTTDLGGAPMPSTTTGGLTSYYVSQTENGCEGPRSKIDVVVIPTPKTNLVVTGSEACKGNDASITVASSEAGVTYEAFSNTIKMGQGIGNGSDLTFDIPTNFLNEGYYTLSLTATGCGTTVNMDNTAEILLLGDPGIITGPANTIICNNANTGLLYSITPVTGAANYEWSIDNSATVSSNGSSGSTVTTTNSYVSVDLTSTNINPTFITVYAITAKGLKSCGSSKSVIKQLQGYEPIEDILPPIDNICQGEEITFTVDNRNAEYYKWSFSATDSIPRDYTATATRTFDVPGTYTLSVTPVHPCKVSIPPIVKTFNVIETPIANAGADTTMSAYHSVILNGTGSSVGNYLWSSNDAGAAILDNRALVTTADFKSLNVTFTLTVTDPVGAGCIATDTKEVILDLRVKDLPNTFTPNGDGNHDVYEIPNINYYPKSVVYIYNQWGEMVFKSNTGYTNPWDGRRNGNECEIGAYFMVIEFNQDGIPSIKETINLLR